MQKSDVRGRGLLLLLLLDYEKRNEGSSSRNSPARQKGMHAWVHPPTI
jgi:hypothetical protein